MKKIFKTVLTSRVVTGTILGVPLALATQVQAANIIVVSHGQANDAFWSVVKNGVEKAAKDSGVNVSYRSPETFDTVAMGQLIDAAVNQGPDGLVVSIPDADALSPSIKRAVDAGIPVITMNAGSDVSKALGALLHVGQDEFDSGKAAGFALASLGGQQALCVNHEVGNVSLDQRCAGFAEAFGKSNVTVLPTGNDPAEVESKVKAALSAHDAIDTVMTLSAFSGGEPALAAIKAIGKGDSVKVATFDLSSNFLEAVSKGEAAFAIDQQQFLQGYLPVSFLALHAQYGLIPGSNVASGPNLITKEKAAQVIELSAQGIR